MKKYFLLPVFLFFGLFPSAYAAEGPGVCRLLPNGEFACQIWEDLNRELEELVADELTLRGEDDESIAKRGAVQELIASKRKQIQSAMIEALSTYDRTAGFKATLGLQVGNEGSLSLIETQGGTWIPSKIIKLMAQIIGTFAILILAFGGLLMITSEGDENRLQNGKNIFFYTIIGLLVAFMSYIGVQFIISVLFTTGGE